MLLCTIDLNLEDTHEDDKDAVWDYKSLGYKKLEFKVSSDRHDRLKKDVEDMYSTSKSWGEIRKRNFILIGKYDHSTQIRNDDLSWSY